jgi:dihydroorotate dehydrogenase electron transfer subunit
MNKSNRNRIQVSECLILAHYHLAGEQHILTLSSEFIANNTKAGQFVHLQVSDVLAMRRPISIMSVDIENSTFDLLYKVIGEGTRQLSQRQIGEKLSVIGPIGNGFNLNKKKRPLLIGGGVGMPPMIAIAQQIKVGDCQPFVILGSEVDFPFESKVASNGLDYQGATQTMPLLEDWGFECRLASLQGFEGVYQGYVTDLARVYLQGLSVDERAQIEIFACGPYPMLKAVAELAKEYNLACQVSLEEYMACAVGGCAGCVVEVQTDAGVAMKRVCVDGPVFDAKQVF